MEPEASPLAHDVIGCAIEIHRELGPGLLESAYCHCLGYELSRRGISFLRECSSTSTRALLRTGSRACCCDALRHSPRGSNRRKAN
ncbi:MAG: GxxExxY protein [Acidobacteriota bacterium]